MTRRASRAPDGDVAESGTIGGASWGARRATMAAGAERADCDAPGEFLAEFLSAIMRRQYAEALKYCRLILQYEPHNATARGFFPLLQHKLRAHEAAAASAVPDSDDMASIEGAAGAAGAGAGRGSHCSDSKERSTRTLQQRNSAAMDEAMDLEESGSSPRSRSGSAGSVGSCGSQSSLELDSSDAPAHSSPSLSLSRRTDNTDSASGEFGASGVSVATGESGAWSGSVASSGSVVSGASAVSDTTTTDPLTEPDTDDNGNPPTRHAPEDVQNDNAESGTDSQRAPHFKNVICQKLGLRR